MGFLSEYGETKQGRGKTPFFAPGSGKAILTSAEVFKGVKDKNTLSIKFKIIESSNAEGNAPGEERQIMYKLNAPNQLYYAKEFISQITGGDGSDTALIALTNLDKATELSKPGTVSPARGVEFKFVSKETGKASEEGAVFTSVTVVPVVTDAKAAKEAQAANLKKI